MEEELLYNNHVLAQNHFLFIYRKIVELKFLI